MKEFPSKETEPGHTRGVSRRRMMKRLLGSAGVGMALPGISAGSPVLDPVTHAATTQVAEASNADSGWKPSFFDGHQNQTLIALAERIVPNSAHAQVNRFIDALLSVDTQESQKSFLVALGEFDHEAITRYSHPFKELSEDQQNAILSDASTAKPSQPHQGMRRGRRPAIPKPGSAEPVLTLRDYFDNIKGAVMRAYYSSEFGMKELGWTGQVAWDSLPGCSHHHDGHQ